MLPSRMPGAGRSPRRSLTCRKAGVGRHRHEDRGGDVAAAGVKRTTARARPSIRSSVKRRWLTVRRPPCLKAAGDTSWARVRARPMASAPLAALLASEPTSDPGVLLERFLAARVRSTGLALYPAQEGGVAGADGRSPRAARHAHRLGEVAGGGGAALQGPGRGEDLLLHRADQGAGQREVLRPLRRLRRRSNVGMLTGDASINRDAPIVCCTAEILANLALREASRQVRRTW